MLLGHLGLKFQISIKIQISILDIIYCNRNIYLPTLTLIFSFSVMSAENIETHYFILTPVISLYKRIYVNYVSLKYPKNPCLELNSWY